MVVELRKRKEAPPAPERPAKKAAASKSKKAENNKTAVEKVQESVIETVDTVKKTVAGKANGKAAEPAKTADGPPKVGDTVDLATFGGEVETHDGHKTTLANLVEESKAGVVLFTYPKASTPGCKAQVCLFRDSYTPLTATGYSIYGLSNDSPKANNNFRTAQKLPYTLLCDPPQTLISAIGLKKAQKGTTRGVFVIDKSGKVRASEPGGPAATVEVVRKLLSGSASQVPTGDDVEAAKTAAEAADTAAKVDS